MVTGTWPNQTISATGGGAVSSVAGRTGAVTLGVADVSGALSAATAAATYATASGGSLTNPALSGETYSTANATAGANAQGQGAFAADQVFITSTPSNPSGVTLPAATTGRCITVVNLGTNPVTVFPASGASIDGLAANAGVTLAVNGLLEFFAQSNTAWYSQLNTTVNASQLVGVLPIAKGSSGTSTPSIVAGTNVTVTGTWPNQTISATGGGAVASVAGRTGAPAQ